MIHTQPEQLFLKDFFYTRMARTLAPHSHSACPCPTLRVGGPLGAWVLFYVQQNAALLK